MTLAAGVFARQTFNAANHSETKEYDPRFGVVIRLTGPNALVSSWVVDDFGRKVQETLPDGTGTAIAHCYLPVNGLNFTSNSTSCPTPLAGEVPANAVRFVHSEPRDTANAKSGPFTRVYSDKLGRTVRTVTEGFDGADQPVAVRGALVARDIAYGTYGQKEVETQPYFLQASGKGNGSATAAGTFNDFGVTLTQYDELGRPTAVYSADPNGSQTAVAYGSYGTRRSSRQRVVYQGLNTQFFNDKEQVRLEEKNADGQVVRIKDHTGADLVHQHDAFGNLVATKDALQNRITLKYDIRGRKTELKDPDAGWVEYAYDALGQLVWQRNANQRALNQPATTMAYDTLGRMSQRVEPEYTTTWTYDSCTKGKGKLCESNTSHGINRKWVYDGFGRPTSSRTTVANGPSFASATSYDTVTGRVTRQVYPTGLTVNHGYSPGRGYLESLRTVHQSTVTPLPGSPSAGWTMPANHPLWRATVISAAGALEQQLYGNNVVSRASFEAYTGRIKGLSAGLGTASGVQNQTYTWDSLSNLTGRTDSIGDSLTGAVTETFSYGDGINRLTAYSVTATAIPGSTRTVTLQYNALGMLLSKSDVGVYRYGAQGANQPRPHALLGVTKGTASTVNVYDANGNLTGVNDGKYRSISYTSFNLPDSQSGIGGPTGSPRYTWLYDENHQRFKETRTNSSGTRTTWNLHPDNQGGLGFEREDGPTGASNRHYLTAGGQVIGVLVSNGALPTLAVGQTAPASVAVNLVKVEYWHKDHLGSVTATTDHLAAVTARQAYDPFGMRRFANGQYDEFGTLVIDWAGNSARGTDRGYTGHEHLDDVGLIHMNGRIFDPRLGVMLQADPFIQDLSSLQNFNRYGYCSNSPLGCTDPSGYLFKWLARKWREEIWRRPIGRALVAIAVSTLVGPGGGANWMFGVASDSIAGAAIAGFAGGAVGTGTFKGAFQGAFSAGMFNAAGNLISGGTITTHGASGAEMGWAAGVALHGVAGCVTSEVAGGNCGAGAISAAFTKALSGPIASVTGGNAYAGALAAAVVGGTAAELGGGKFQNGAVTGAFSYLFNELMHQTTPYQRGEPHGSGWGSGTHWYNVENFACSVAQSGCSVGAVDMLIKQFPAPTACVVTPGCTPSAVVTGDQSFAWPVGSVTHIVSPSLVINQTLDTHLLHDGMVMRSAVERNGAIYVRSLGFGTGRFPGPNVINAAALWGLVDRRIRTQLGDGK